MDHLKNERVTRRKLIQMLSTFGIGMIALGKGAKDSFFCKVMKQKQRRLRMQHCSLMLKISEQKVTGKVMIHSPFKKLLIEVWINLFFFPSGTYLISSSIVVPLYISLLGEGNKSRIKKYSRCSYVYPLIHQSVW